MGRIEPLEQTRGVEAVLTRPTWLGRQGAVGEGYDPAV